MPVYNGSRHLREAVDGVLAQSLTGFEFIIIDDGSADETRAILDSYADQRLMYLRNDSREGVTTSLNRGLSVARGEYVACMNADDVSL